MEQKNNEITEVKFTQNDILAGLMAMDEETRQAISTITLDQLDSIANNPEYLQYIHNTCDAYITAYQKMKDAVNIFIEAINNQKEKGFEMVIDDMIKKYKGFSREERLEFNTKLLKVTDIENSVDTFKYTWNKFMNTLNGMKV